MHSGFNNEEESIILWQQLEGLPLDKVQMFTVFVFWTQITLAIYMQIQ